MNTKNENTEVLDESKNIEEPSGDLWEELIYFPTSVYILKKPEFLETVKEVSSESIEKIKLEVKLDEIYPAYQSGNYFDDPRLENFAAYVGQTAWNILNHQGYAMDNFLVQFNEMWTQEHYKHSSMEEHTHGYGSVISGFYFIECPENCSKAIVYDPRPAKVITNLPEKDITKASYGSNMINFSPEPGMLLFTNSWLPHSFTRHGSDEPMKFVHFNLSVMPVDRTACPTPTGCVEPAEVV